MITAAEHKAFKAYDIRGTYGEHLTEDLAYKLGRALGDYFEHGPLVVGQDMRPSSAPLSDALIKGVCRQGAKVYRLGVVSTPMTYFANTALAAAGSVMVTASHNPPPDNGFKINRRDAQPVGGESGLQDIRKRVERDAFSQGQAPGEVHDYDIKPAYWQRMRQAVRFSSKPRIVCDYANAVGSIELAGLTDLFDITHLYQELDGTFPNHLANPLLPETLDTVRREVLAQEAELGVAFDGDADRLGFVDEHGELVQLDLMTAILADDFLARGPCCILHDVRSSWAVRDHIEFNGGTPVMWKVGHANMKPKMRDLQAPFGGELAGHYYFGELDTSESTALALIRLTNLMDRRDCTLSELAQPLRGYANSGEINIELDDRETIETIFERVRTHYPGQRHELDGITIEYQDWWFNLRASNTEPKLRVLVEAVDDDLLARHRNELIDFIQESL